MMDSWIVIGLLLVGVALLGGWLARTQKRVRTLEQDLLQTRRTLQALTEQIASAYALRETLLKVVDDPLLVMNSRHEILFANPAAEKLLGAGLVGQTLIRATRQHELEDLLDEAKTLDNEIPEQLIDIEGQTIRARAVYGQNGASSVEVIALRDMTEVRRLGRARREMVANISHELRTPITSIGLLADTLLNGALEKPKRAKKMLSDIRREVDLLAQLVQEMRDLSLIESGQLPIKLMPTPLLPMVQATVEQVQPIAERKLQQISVNVPLDICVLADAAHVQRALKNIVHNAVKFSPEGSLIEVSAIANDEEATVSVKDNGPGISAEDLPRIFERFFQASRARQHDGTGLGLAIARHIVLGHGGKIWAESAEGQGATFFFSLPLVEREPAVDNGQNDSVTAP
jgi:two-component system phosphate regulon sensor histidine kinase PhoR